MSPSGIGQGTTEAYCHPEYSERSITASPNSPTKWRSWDTKRIAPGNCARVPSSASRVSISRWFVGSSSSRRLAPPTRSAASATFARSPPLIEPIGCRTWSARIFRHARMVRTHSSFGWTPRQKASGDSAGFHVLALLGEVAHADTGPHLDASPVGPLQAAHKAEERRLARAVGPHQGAALTAAEAHEKPIEKRPAIERLRQPLDPQDGVAGAAHVREIEHRDRRFDIRLDRPRLMHRALAENPRGALKARRLGLVEVVPVAHADGRAGDLARRPVPLLGSPPRRGVAALLRLVPLPLLALRKRPLLAVGSYEPPNAVSVPRRSSNVRDATRLRKTRSCEMSMQALSTPAR